MLKHVRWEDVQKEELNPLLERQYLSAGSVTVARFLLRQGLFIPEHSHHNEQLTYVLEGALKLTFPERAIVVRSGEMACIPPNLPHSAEALEDCRVFDIFTPPRADWESKADAYLRNSTAVKS